MAGTGDSDHDSGRAAFGARVRALRLQEGLSQEQLAERAGLHRTYVSSLERGQRNVGLDNIHILARALGVHPGQLFEEG
jgi:transcriptional regulator with XRE-family HTH domain